MQTRQWRRADDAITPKPIDYSARYERDIVEMIRAIQERHRLELEPYVNRLVHLRSLGAR